MEAMMAEIPGARGFARRLRDGAIVGAAAAMIISPFAANAQQATKIAAHRSYGPTAIELQDAKRITADTDCKKFKFSRAEDAADTAVCEYFRGQVLQRDIKATDRDIKATDRDIRALDADIQKADADIACMAIIRAERIKKGTLVTRDIILRYGKDRMCELVRDYNLSQLTPQGLPRPQL